MLSSASLKGHLNDLFDLSELWINSYLSITLLLKEASSLLEKVSQRKTSKSEKRFCQCLA